MRKVKSFPFEEEKFKHLVHYICYRCHDPSMLGATKLNKVLLRSDLSAFVQWGKPITGETYKKQQFGPTPKHIQPVLKTLKKEGAIVERNAMFFGYPKKEYIALTKPDLGLFTADEISIVDEAIDYICREKTAKAASDETHDAIWELALIGEDIPYYAVFASQLGEITDEDLRWATKKLAHLS